MPAHGRSGRRPHACVSAQNAEIFTLTYGSIVRQLITDLEDIDEVNKQLDTMCGTPLLTLFMILTSQLSFLVS